MQETASMIMAKCFSHNRDVLLGLDKPEAFRQESQ